MDKQELLKNFVRQKVELNEVIAQAEYNIGMALKQREFAFVERNAGIIVKAENSLRELTLEIAKVREEIEEESREVI